MFIEKGFFLPTLTIMEWEWNADEDEDEDEFFGKG